MGMYKVISLFSGVGGSSLGYKLAGLKVLAAVEFIDYQAHNYRLNHKNTKVYEEDIRTLDPTKVLKDLNLERYELDILDGSPPCSSFSTAGKREEYWGQEKEYSNTKQRTDDLFFEYIRFIDTIQPKVFVAENVSGLVKGKAKGYFLEILDSLKKCGYNVKAKLMNAKYYNVPQSRQRLIFIGVRNDLNIIPSFPKPSNKIKTIRDAWINLPKENKQASIDLEINESKKYKYVKYLKKLKKSPNKVLYGDNVGGPFNLCRLSLNLPSNTVCQMGGVRGAAAVCHPIKDRKLTIYELKRITTFPDDFKLVGTFAQQWEACGRSVPPKFMQAIAENIRYNILDKV
jgi:DNA (cytosine-5)-methyltransferase 1